MTAEGWCSARGHLKHHTGLQGKVFYVSPQAHSCHPTTVSLLLVQVALAHGSFPDKNPVSEPRKKWVLEVCKPSTGN